MYGKSSDAEQFLNRTGNHSLRFKRTGDNSDLSRSPTGHIDVSYTVDSAAASAVEARRILDRIEEKKAEYQQLQQRIADLNEELKKTMPHEKFAKIKERREKYGKQAFLVADDLKRMKRELKAMELKDGVREKTFEGMFVSVARQTLPNQVFENLREAAVDALKKLNQQEEA